MRYTHSAQLYEDDDEKTTVPNKTMSACFVDEYAQTLIAREDSGGKFIDSRLEELEGLAQIGRFEVANKTEAEGRRLYNSVFRRLNQK